MKASMDHTVREIAFKHPASARVFESLLFPCALEMGRKEGVYAGA